MSTMTISPLQPGYVTKSEFKSFEIKVDERFDGLEKKFDGLKTDFGGLKTEIAEQNKSDMATWREIIRDDFKLATEILEGNLDTKLGRFKTEIIDAVKNK